MNHERLKGQWNQVVGLAKQTWSKFTNDELLGIEGDLQRLSGLLQERYGIAREEAEKQIQSFMLSLDATLGIKPANDRLAESPRRKSKGGRTA